MQINYNILITFFATVFVPVFIAIYNHYSNKKLKLLDIEGIKKELGNIKEENQIFKNNLIEIKEILNEIKNEFYIEKDKKNKIKELYILEEYFIKKIFENDKKLAYIDKANKYIEVVSKLFDYNLNDINDYDVFIQIFDNGYENCKRILTEKLNKNYNLDKFFEKHKIECENFKIQLKEIFLDVFNKKEMRIIALAKSFLNSWSENYIKYIIPKDNK